MNDDSTAGVMPHVTPSDPHTHLTRLCMTMFAEAFKLPAGTRLLAALMRIPARHAARHALEFDRLAGLHSNLQAPSRYLVEVLSAGLTVRGVEHVPARGPALVTCNHPGIFDAMAVFASLPRADVTVIARPRNLLDALPNIRRQIIVAQEENGSIALRAAVRHLAAGGLLVTFPRGAIEPDPALHPQAAEQALQHWSPSLNLLAKHVPGLTIIPAAVGGIVSISARESWLARRFAADADRDWMAATLQFMLPAYRDVHPVVLYGAPAGETLAQVQAATRALYISLGNTI